MTTHTQMSEDQRRKVFWLLKKYSSYTAWEALVQAYYRFADAYMLAHKLRTPDPSAADRAEMDHWMAGHLKRVLDGRIGFEKGLPRLRQGDRSVWLRNSRGVLVVGLSTINFIDRIMDESEFGLDWMKNKDDVLAKYRDLVFWCGGLGAVTERKQERQVAVLAPRNALVIHHPEHGYQLNDPAYLNFPRELPEVPHPKTLVVDTGDEVPADGIYEPEWGPMQDTNKSLWRKLTLVQVGKPSLSMSREPPGLGLALARRANTGCMNYLLANTSAPMYQEGELDRPVPVSWRLIWKDERYLDGSIPAEETQYLAPVVDEAADRGRCEAGHACPREGYWFTPAQADSRRHFKSGQVMPAIGGGYGATIWQWDPGQAAPTG